MTMTKLDEETHGVGGLIRGPVEPREQDVAAIPADGYAVVFFPKYTGIGDATIWRSTVTDTLSQTPEAAIQKYMDRIAPGQTWSTYFNAGWRVRKIVIRDAGDAI